MPEKWKAISISPAAKHWLETSEFGYVLHVFEPVVNLANDQAKVLSIATRRVGNGPFCMLVEEQGFPDYIDTGSQIGALKDLVQIGDLQIDYGDAELWDPHPVWPNLADDAARRDWTRDHVHALLKQHADPESFAQLIIAPAHADQPWATILKAAEEPVAELLVAIAAQDPASLQTAASHLAGLGPGLTPAGDDFLVGAMHGLYSTKESLKALTLCLNIADAAIPRTNSLSAAWLEVAARGEAGEPWHELLSAVQDQDERALEAAVLRILPTGHTSGADALGGFLAVLDGAERSLGAAA